MCSMLCARAKFEAPGRIQVIDLASEPAAKRYSMLAPSGGDCDTIPQLHVRSRNGDICIGGIHKVEEMHDFGVRGLLVCLSFTFPADQRGFMMLGRF